MTIYSRSPFLRWRYIVTVGTFLFLILLWEQKSDKVSSPQGYAPYHEGGIALPSYFAPFRCDLNALPARTRMITRAEDNYVIMGHGFKDMITDKFWDGNGAFGWEDSLSHHMDFYINAIKSFEPSRDGFMDLGANIGTHALYLAAKGHNVHIFEPTYANYVLMQCSLAIAGASSRVRLNTFGLGDKAVKVCMSSAKDNYGDSRVNQTATDCGPEQQALVGTLDNYYRTFARGQKIAVLKIDIQGFEVAALHHATKLFDSQDAPVAVFFEYDPDMIRSQGSDPLELGTYLWERGYSIWRDDNPEPITPEQFAVFGTETLWTGGIDLFAVKNSWKVKLDDAGFRFVPKKVEPDVTLIKLAPLYNTLKANTASAIRDNSQHA